MALLVCEGIIRIYLDVLPAGKHAGYVADPLAAYRLEPEPAREDTAGNEYHVNALGFRDREHSPVKAAGVQRVLGIGDSFVFGEVRLADNFLRVAERAMNEAVRSPVGSTQALENAAPASIEPSATGSDGATANSVLRSAGPNAVPSPAGRQQPHEMFLMGLGGYSPVQYLGVLRSVGLSVDPDRVLMCLYVGNDITGLFTKSVVLHGQLYSVSSSNPWLNLLRHSRLFVFLEKWTLYRLRVARVRAGLREEESAGQPRPSGSAPERTGLTPAYLAVLDNRLPVFRTDPSERIQGLWKATGDVLGQFDQECRSRHIPWNLVIIPDEIQVDPSVRAEALRRLGRERDRFDWDRPQRVLLDLAARLQVPALDLLPILRAAHRADSTLYFPNDTHWNVRGNRIAGTALARFLCDQEGGSSGLEWKGR